MSFTSKRRCNVSDTDCLTRTADCERDTPRHSRTSFTGRPPANEGKCAITYRDRAISIASLRTSASIVFLPSIRCKSRICLSASLSSAAGATASPARPPTSFRPGKARATGTAGSHLCRCAGTPQTRCPQVQASRESCPASGWCSSGVGVLGREARHSCRRCHSKTYPLAYP